MRPADLPFRSRESAITTADVPLSVILPVYNAGRFLTAAIESVLAQGFGNFELLAIDDGSTDSCLRILRKFEQADPRVRVIATGHTGLVGALNRGIAEARGALIARMDADDIALPGRFEQQCAFMRANPKVSVLGSAATVIDAHGRRIGAHRHPLAHDAIAQALHSGNCALTHPTVMMRRAAVLEVGSYDEFYRYSEDYALWLRLAERFHLANLPDRLIRYRIHNGNVSVRHRADQIVSSTVAMIGSRRRLAGLPDPFLTVRMPHRAALRRVALDPFERSALGLSLARLILKSLREKNSETAFSTVALAEQLTAPAATPIETAVRLVRENAPNAAAPFTAVMAKLALAYHFAATGKPFQSIGWLNSAAASHPRGTIGIAGMMAHWLVAKAVSLSPFGVLALTDLRLRFVRTRTTFSDTPPNEVMKRA